MRFSSRLPATAFAVLFLSVTPLKVLTTQESTKVCGTTWTTGATTTKDKPPETSDKAQPIPNVQIQKKSISKTSNLKQTQLLSTSDSLGNFTIALPPGIHSLQLSALGYKTKPLTINTANILGQNGEIECLNIYLDKISDEITQADGIVIQGIKHSHYVPINTVKTNVITSQHFERDQTNNLMDAIKSINGIMQQIDCGVCYTNSIRINGMSGGYTTVLIDGVPIIGALGSIYGLNGINPSLIERIEIVKGPSSVSLGMEAIGGVVNVITKSANSTGVNSVSVSRDNLGELSGDIGYSIPSKRSSTLLSGSYLTSKQYTDGNKDNFTDAPNGFRGALFAKHSRDLYNKTLSVTAKAYSEERYGGVREWSKPLKGSSAVYGEYIKTSRMELLSEISDSATYSASPRKMLGRISGSVHLQDSYYGDTRFKANQTIANAQMVREGIKVAGSRLNLGANLKYDQYKDLSPVNSGNHAIVVPGVFAENSYLLSDDIKIVLGARLDQHKTHGSIFSPRLHAMYTATKNTTLRLSSGSGFRVVNLVTEDHAALSGARDVVISEKLSPERSITSALNLNQIVEFGLNNMMIDLDAFYTVFSNKILPDYDTDETKIYYSNSDDRSVARGVGIYINQNFSRFPLLYSFGVNFQEVYENGPDNKRVWETFTPKISAVATVSYSFPNSGITVDYTGIGTGSKPMPVYSSQYAKALSSPAHWIHDFQIAWGPSKLPAAKMFLTVKNIFNYTQGTPLINETDPYSAGFDTNYIWGPIVGRKLALKLRVATN